MGGHIHSFFEIPLDAKESDTLIKHQTVSSKILLPNNAPSLSFFEHGFQTGITKVLRDS